MVCSWNLYQMNFLKKMLFGGVILFDPSIFQKSGIISAEIKKWKSHYFFVKPAYLWKKIFISRYGLIIFICQSWSVNSGWLTCAQKSREEILFLSKCCQLYLVYKSKVFNKYIVDFKQKSQIFKSFFADKSILPSQLILLIENSLANCHFFKKDILKIIRNPDSNKAHSND